MCGVIGTAGFECAVDASSLMHRGPDGSNVVQIRGAAPVTLGHTRLAINDLSEAGQQPWQDEELGLTMAYNGEIYNYPDLRKDVAALGYRFKSSMDGEVILPLFAEYGIDFLRRIDGIFAVAIHDHRTGEVWLARDRLGVKPMFWAAVGSGIVFGSEPDAVRDHAGLAQTTDPLALAQYLTFLWVPAPRSGVAGVMSLRPEEVLRWCPEGHRTSPAPHALTMPAELQHPPAAEVDATVDRLLEAAVQRQLLADVPIGVMASGGVDSTLIWSYARDHVTHSFTTAVQAGGEEGHGADATAAASIADLFGTNHVEIPVANKAEPFRLDSGDLLADPSYRLAHQIAQSARSKGIKVLLSGQGADEVFGGYRRHQAAYWLEHLPRMPGFQVPSAVDRFAQRSVRGEYARRLAAAAGERDPFRKLMSLSAYTSAEERASLLDADTADVSDEIVFEEHRRAWETIPKGWSFTKRVLHIDLVVYMPGLNLAVTDRATMASGVEARVPFLDGDLVDYALSLAPEALLTARARKRPLVSIAKRTLPSLVWDRPKAAFGVPVTSLPSEGSRRQMRMISFAVECLNSPEAI